MDTSFLDKFLQQTKTTNLKTKDLYPDLINDLDVKVSFGMGTPTHVPWISTLGPGMSTSNGYYPVYLYYKKENILILAYGISETVDYEEPWTREIVDSNQKIKDFLDKPFRYGESYVFQTYVPEITETEVKYFRNEREISKEDIAKDLKDITNKYKECLDIEVKDEGSDLSKGLFYMESQLEDFIIQNWNESEFGKKYDLIIKDGELESQQYRTDIGPIDILATDKNTGVAATEGDQTVWMLSYAYGPVTASASASDYDVGTSTNDQELSSYAISYTISDELSVTYGTEEIEVGGAVSDAEYESISASYTAGGMTITAAMKEGENVANGTASNQDFEYWSLGASFAF